MTNYEDNRTKLTPVVVAATPGALISNGARRLQTDMFYPPLETSLLEGTVV